MTRLILTILLSLPALLSGGKSFTPVAKVTEQERHAIAHDHLGTPAGAYDVNGNEVWSRTLDMNGEVIEENGNIGMIPFLFQGQYYDRETGLAYNRFRYYSSQMGMYVSQDLIGLDGGILNLYGYVDDTNLCLDLLGLTASYRRTKHVQNRHITRKKYFIQ